MENKIRFFRISEIDVRKAVKELMERYPAMDGKFSIKGTEDEDGFYLIISPDVPVEMIYNLGVMHGDVLIKENPFKNKQND